MWEEYEPGRVYEQERRYGRAERRKEGHRNGRKKQRSRKKRHIVKTLVCLLLIVLMIQVLMLVKDRIAGGSGFTLTAFTNGKVREILMNREKYPDELIDLVQGNEEAADFVLDYPEKKDLPPAETIGDVTAGDIPLLLQWDERWGYCLYGDKMIAVNGCGPTAVAMVAAGLTGDNTITPYEVARYSEDNGYYAGDSGTSWTLMTEGAAHFGVRGVELGLDESAVFSALEAGHPIICSMRPGDFTTTGHFIVLTGAEGGRIRVNDPNSRIRSEKLWDYDRLEYQINNLWVFTVQ